MTGSDDGPAGDAGGVEGATGGGDEPGPTSPGPPGSNGEGAEFRLTVPEMDCPSCAGKVESALDDVEGVEDRDTRPTSGTVRVTVDPGRASAGAVTDAVEAAGYEVTAVGGSGAGDAATGDGDGGVAEAATVWRSRRAVKTAIGGVSLAGGLVAEFLLAERTVGTVLGVEFLLADLLFLAAIGVAGQAIVRGGYYSARNLNLDVDFLMTAAIVAAVTASLISGSRLYFEAATLSVLFSVAELLERYSMDRARNSLRELMELSPDTARVRRDGGTVSVPVSDLRVGEVALVRPGEKVPVDGRVVEGESAVDQSPITGESVPVDVSEGDEVYAGTVNEGGYLEVEATAEAEETTISRIVRLVEDAGAEQTEREQFVERFAAYYTPAMVALAVLVAAVPPLALGAPWVPWFVAGITMLVLACPCAFVISTPVSVVSGITSAAKNGVLIKGGRHLEAMGSVEAVAMDKTGTLTRGELAVTDVVPLNGHSEAEVLRCARGLEARSEHPIGEAIVAHAEGGGADLADPEVDGFENRAGEGVRATLDGVTHWAGKPGLFEDLGFDLEHVHVAPEVRESGDRSGDGGPDGAEDAEGTGGSGGLSAEVRDVCDRQGCLNLVEDTIPRLQREGKTVVLVGREDTLEGIVAVADEVRPDAARTVERLRERGLSVVMLTGDNEGTARAVAEAVGVSDYRAGLLPEDKVSAVEDLREEYDGVAMVGDGVNDAPALAAATVGIAMGAAGTDAAIETADVALLGDDISKLPYLHELSARADGVIRQNVWASLAVKAVLAAGVPLGLVSVAVAVLVGDAGMTVGVTGNALRLSRISPDDAGD